MVAGLATTVLVADLFRPVYPSGICTAAGNRIFYREFLWRHRAAIEREC